MLGPGARHVRRGELRAHPLHADASDDDQADAFIEALCQLTGVDDRSCFQTRGLTAQDATNQRIDAEPDVDLAQRFGSAQRTAPFAHLQWMSPGARSTVISAA